MGRIAPTVPVWPVGLLAIGGALGAMALARRSEAYWACCLCLAAMACGALRILPLREDLVQLERFAPREAKLVLRIEQTFSGRNADQSAGIARIADAPAPLAPLIEQRIQYSLSISAQPQPPLAGESYAAFGVLRPLPEGNEASGFEDYLRRRGIAYRFIQGSLLEREAPAPDLAYFAQSVKESLAAALSRSKQPNSEASHAYKALMLSEKSDLSPEQRELFLRNGTMHLFAISGLHIGVIATCIHYALVLARLPRRWRPLVALAAIAVFVLATGGAPSAWRALFMIACFFLCNGARRQAAPINALALSALAVLLALPAQLFEAGFQMSYLTVACLLLLGLPLARSLNAATPVFGRGLPESRGWLQRKLITGKEWLVSSFAIGVAAFLPSSILGCYYFQVLPSYGIAINLALIPMASLAIIAGFLAIMMAAIPGNPLTELFNNAALVIIDLIHATLRFADSMPASSIVIEPLRLATLLAAILTTLTLSAIAYAQSPSPRALIWQLAPIAAAGCWLGIIAW